MLFKLSSVVPMISLFQNFRLRACSNGLPIMVEFSDNGYGVALDISGDIFITGQTNNSVGFAMLQVLMTLF